MSQCLRPPFISRLITIYFRGWAGELHSDLAQGTHRFLPLYLDSDPLRLQASPHAAEVHHDVPLAAWRHRR